MSKRSFKWFAIIGLAVYGAFGLARFGLSVAEIDETWTLTLACAGIALVTALPVLAAACARCWPPAVFLLATLIAAGTSACAFTLASWADVFWFFSAEGYAILLGAMFVASMLTQSALSAARPWSIALAGAGLVVGIASAILGGMAMELLGPDAVVVLVLVVLSSYAGARLIRK